MWRPPVGLVVPIPTLPFCVTIKWIPVDEPMTNSGVFTARLTGLTESCPHGVEDAMPTLPPEAARYAEPDEVRAVVEAYVKVEATVVEVAVKLKAVTLPAIIADDEAKIWSRNHRGEVVELTAML